jgi:transposase
VGLAVDGANRPDFKLARETIESIPVDRPEPTEDEPQGMSLDKGYDYDEVQDVPGEFGFTAHIRPRGEGAEAVKREAGYRARRWVVERTHSWLNRFRGILVRWSKKPESYIAMLHLAFAIITWRSTGLFG